LLVSGIVLLSMRNEPHLAPMPIWLTATILSRDLLILIGLAVIHYVVGKVIVRPHLIGKAATVCQMAAVLWALFKLSNQWLYGLCIAAAVLTGVSGLIYVFDGMRQLAKHPSSFPANKSPDKTTPDGDGK